MCDMAGLLPCIPQLHGMLFATRILVVLRSGVPSDSSQPEIPAHGSPQTPADLDRRRKGLFVHDLSLV
jgi:hypothetical protein